MRSYRSLWVLIDFYALLRVFMRPSSSLWYLMDSCKSFKRPFGFLWVLNGPDASLWVLICLYRSLRVLMGPHRSICVLKDSNGFLWVLLSSYASLWVLIGSSRLYESLWVLMGTY